MLLLQTWIAKMSRGNRTCRARMLRVMRVVPMDFGEQHDTRTNGPAQGIYNAADRWPTNQVSAWQAGRGSRPTRRHPREEPREDVRRVWHVGEVRVTKMLRGNCFRGIYSCPMARLRQQLIQLNV